MIFNPTQVKSLSREPVFFIIKSKKGSCGRRCPFTVESLKWRLWRETVQGSTGYL